jgi:hypothetical protein
MKNPLDTEEISKEGWMEVEVNVTLVNDLVTFFKERGVKPPEGIVCCLALVGAHCAESSDKDIALAGSIEMLEQFASGILMTEAAGMH